MTARLDHITIVAPSLETGAAYVEAALGVCPGPGRKHPGMATHNMLLALGSDVYLEVISVDPSAGQIERPRWFGLDRLLPHSPARLAAWVASTEDIGSLPTSELGHVETMRREHQTWQMTVTADGSLPLGGAAPLLIQRSSSVNPAAALTPNELVFKTLIIQHPDPSRVLALFERIGLASQSSVNVSSGPECALRAEIQTGRGLRALGEL